MHGTYIVRGNTAVKVGEEEGVWKYITLNDKQDMILGGHYNGLSTLKRTENGWEFNEKVKGFDESSRFLAQDTVGAIWISHGSKGVFRLLLNNELDSASNVKLYTSEHGLPSDEHNILFRYNDEVYISTVNGIYRYQVNRIVLY
jgi:ligand-binding sensor domain-containing protein